MQFIEGGVTAAKGFLAGGIHCGIRKNKSKADLAMIFSKTPCAAAGVYTQNLVKGAPILVTRKNIADGRAQAVICNSVKHQRAQRGVALRVYSRVFPFGKLGTPRFQIGALVFEC